ncbi:diguanylate cyclase/phosphodiesterase (GGDEF & EAL domains) with PAS/PAC sensor(s) [Salinisphaera sp. LB1]|nr:diguanylate cyclase/phosphodiesterase (GGDEF & EAL domains) with PAS/PAC sensor(s) [Salinisphaera sp. LB1]
MGLDSAHALSMTIPGAVFRRIRDVHGNDRYTYLAGQLVDELGIDPDAAREDPSRVFNLMEPNDRQLLESAIQSTARSGSGIDLVVRFHSPSGKQYWLRIISRPTQLGDGTIVWDGLAIDITGEKQAQAHAAWLADHDRLTGLLNRAEFIAHIERALEAAHKHSQQIALARLAVRGMFKVNEKHGLPGGDALLCQIADRLDDTLPEGSIIARSHGDVFLVKLEIPDNDGGLAAGLRTLQSAFDAPFDLGDLNPAHVSASIGIARYPEDADTTDDLLRAVALAGDRAHKHPEVDYEFYDREISEAMRQRFQLEDRLRQAIAEEQLEPYYQPQISLSDGRLVGLEALVRWPQADGSLIMPGAFIPLAEEVGLSGRIGRLMLRRVAHDLHTWSANGWTTVPVAVNCSARQFRDTKLVRAYEQEVLEQGLDPGLIHLELTETSFIDNYDNAKRIMDQLNGLGVTFSIDDFGTGFSALSYLSRLPFRVLKIDRSFVAEILDEAHQRNVVQGLIQMASTIGLYIIAEGVETAEQEAELRCMGSDAAQGFYYSPALPAADIPHWHAALSKKLDGV